MVVIGISDEQLIALHRLNLRAKPQAQCQTVRQRYRWAVS
jgi:hypothetical protein